MSKTRRQLIVAALSLSTRPKHKKMIAYIEKNWDTTTPTQRATWYITAMAVAKRLMPTVGTEAGVLFKELMQCPK